MQKVTVLCVGKLKERFYIDAAAEYAKRLSRFCQLEIVELPEHPWFVGAQFHPEFKSRPDRPHPLFFGFVEASLAGQKGEVPHASL